MNCVTQFIAGVDRLANHFIPDDIAVGSSAHKRAHVFLISHILGPFIGSVVPITLYLLDPNPSFAVAVLALSIVAFWIFPFALRAGAPYNPLALISIQNLIFCILWSCYFYGGVNSPTLPWVLVIPLLSFFYIGPSVQLRIIVISMLVTNLAAFFWLWSHASEPSIDMSMSALQALGLVSTSAAALYIIMMALYYAKIQASHAELEGQMREHMATASELRQATAEAERAGAAKGEFLARMSHELRTPLNAVIGYSQILLEEAEAEDDTVSLADLNKIHDAGVHLLKMVNEILDLSKIDAGKMQVDLHCVDLAAVLNDVLRTVAARSEGSGNQFNSAIPENIGLAICDENKIRTIVRQLLENASKFTNGGVIEFTSRRYQLNAQDHLEIVVRDTGIGIAPEQLSRLFENFSGNEDYSTSKYSGAGLGLALAQKLCRLMGGIISVESELNVGSTFRVDLPLAADRDRSVESASIVADLVDDEFGDLAPVRGVGSKAVKDSVE